MKAGDIIFVRGKSPLSKLIRFFDKGRFSHVAIAMSETHILEAQFFTKARITEFYFDEEEYEIIDLGLTDEERDKVVHLGVDMTGKWYDYSQILWYVLKKFFKIKGKNRFNNPNNLICSELIYNLLYSLGKINDVKGLNNDVTPNELYKHIHNLME